MGVCRSIIVHFDKSILLKIYDNSRPPFWIELDEPVSQLVVQMAASELIEKYFEGVVHLFNNKAAVSDDILILKLKELILLLLQTKNSPNVINIMNGLFSQRTFSFKEVVRAHISEPISLETMAHLTNNSLSSFKREFKRIFRTTPGAYIIDKRAEKVANLLIVSDESIAAIGYECGFTSPTHLTKVFKSKYGETPSSYRMKYCD